MANDRYPHKRHFILKNTGTAFFNVRHEDKRMKAIGG